MEYYVYELIDPRDNKPFYVGKGKNDRMYKHSNCESTKKKNPFLYYKLNKIKSLGLEPIRQKVIENLSEPDALQAEKDLISTYGLENLCNILPGGYEHCGAPHSEETKKKMSEVKKGKSPKNLQQLIELVRSKGNQIYQIPSGSYRLRMFVNGVKFDKCFKTYDQALEKRKELLLQVI